MISFNNVTYTYPATRFPAIKDVSFRINEGEMVLLLGASGSGKSTLLRCVNGLVPHFSGGTISGEIRAAGLDPVQESPQMMSQHVGFVFQDPETQFVVDRVEDEIAFALENIALPEGEMHARVNETMQLLELTGLRNRHLENLSGGEQQRVAIAASLVLRPQILILDEPTSQLDPQSANELLNMLVRLNAEYNLTVILAEHRLERILPFADHLIYMDRTEPGVIEGNPRQVQKEVPINPPIVVLGKSLGWDPLPLTIEEGRRLAKSVKIPGALSGVMQTPPHDLGQHRPYIQVESIDAWLGSGQILHEIDLEIHSGEILVLMGPNGAGKSTLVRCLVGILKAKNGRILVNGEDIIKKSVAEVCQSVGYLPQDPNALLFADRVVDELLITLQNHHLSEEDYPPELLLKKLGIGDKCDLYPRDLSSGERQRVALGAITITRPGALLLDEPTRGLDYAAKQSLVQLVHDWRDEGMAILVVTHDVEMAANIADRVVLMENGRITKRGTPARVLSESKLFTPQIAQLFPGTGWLTPGDVPIS